jgi:hypothetical protein
MFSKKLLIQLKLSKFLDCRIDTKDRSVIFLLLLKARLPSLFLKKFKKNPQNVRLFWFSLSRQSNALFF